jgi:hypothetical protein
MKIYQYCKLQKKNNIIFKDITEFTFRVNKERLLEIHFRKKSKPNF